MAHISSRISSSDILEVKDILPIKPAMAISPHFAPRGIGIFWVLEWECLGKQMMSLFHVFNATFSVFLCSFLRNLRAEDRKEASFFCCQIDDFGYFEGSLKRKVSLHLDLY